MIFGGAILTSFDYWGGYYPSILPVIYAYTLGTDETIKFFPKFHCAVLFTREGLIFGPCTHRYCVWKWTFLSFCFSLLHHAVWGDASNTWLVAVSMRCFPTASLQPKWQLLMTVLYFWVPAVSNGPLQRQLARTHTHTHTQMFSMLMRPRDQLS